MAFDEARAEPPDRDRRPGRVAHVPGPSVRRLSLYLRELEGLLRQQCRTVSSLQLGKILGLTDAQVRKDLANFGQFGHPGVGYRVEETIGQIRRILGTDRVWNVLLAGAGNLGRALLSYRGFAGKGFEIVAVFDNDPEKVGQKIGPGSELEVLSVESLAEVVRRFRIEIAILCLPCEVAQPMADRLVQAGIRGILNFAPTTLAVPSPVALAGVDLAVHLEQLAFQVSAGQAMTRPPETPHAT
ncbi:MAG: redox-sensing transcriptional repressor Rex [Phycisphaerae bacterium]|nr:redox-sensing transcriptional repressor Rex [Phycisphaerae bacterium]